MRANMDLLQPHRWRDDFVGRVSTPPQRPLPWVLRTAVETLCGSHDPNDPEVEALCRAGQRISRRADEDTGNVYHNRTHAGEAVWAALALWQCEQAVRLHQGQVPWPVLSGLTLIVAMLAHDLDHPGLFVGASQSEDLGRIERHSADLAIAILEDERVAPQVIARIGQIIHATEPVRGVPAAQEAWLAQPSLGTLLPVLATEADLLASAWFSTGPVRGQWLAQEWRAQVPELAQVISSWSGRRHFLASTRWLSAGALAFGIDRSVAIEQRVLATHGDRWDGLAFDLARTEHLEAMRAAAAI